MQQALLQTYAAFSVTVCNPRQQIFAVIDSMATAKSAQTFQAAAVELKQHLQPYDPHSQAPQLLKASPVASKVRKRGR